MTKAIFVVGVLATSVLGVANPAWAAPVASDDSFAVVAGRSYSFPAPGVLANDTGLPATPTVQWQSPPPAGLTLHADGSVDYAVPANAAGTQTFTYCLLDLAGSPNAQCISNLATVAVHISPPVTVDDSISVTAGTTFTLPAPGVLSNDGNLPDGPVVQWQTSPPAGLTLGADGGISYVVPATAAGTATFTYCVLQYPNTPAAICVSNAATVTVLIAAPVAVDDSYDAVPGTTLTVAAPGVLGNDGNLPDSPAVQWQTNPPAGLTLGADGSISYPAPAGATGTATFTYCLLDQPGSPFAQCVSNIATVTIRYVRATPSPSPGASPSPGVSPSPGGSPSPGAAPSSGVSPSGFSGGATLAQTGPSNVYLIVLGLLLVVVGASAVLVVHRRRGESVQRVTR